MAKTVTLTVRVDDTEFTRFVTKFNAFSAQIGTLNNQFKSINSTIQKTQSNAKTLISTFQDLYSTGKSFLSIINESLKGFVKMATVIGSIGAMLSTGVGMFGLDRLAASILQKRRQAMGIGADYGRMQGVQVGGKALMDDPQALLQSISRGLRGGDAEMQGLAALRVRIGPGAETDPTKVVGTVIRNLYRETHGLPERQILPTGRAFRAGLAISDEDITRIAHMTPKQVEEFIKRLETPIAAPSPKAQEGWANLSQAFERAKVALESAFGERLKELTPHLERLSTSVTDLIKALLDSGTVAKILNWITKQLAKVTAWLSDPKKVQKALDKLETGFNELIPILGLFKDALIEVWDVMKKIYNFLTGNWSWSDVWKGIKERISDPNFWVGKPGTPEHPNPLRPGTGPWRGETPIQRFNREQQQRQRDEGSRDQGTPGTPAAPATPAAPTTAPPAATPPVAPSSQGSIRPSTQIASLMGGSLQQIIQPSADARPIIIPPTQGGPGLFQGGNTQVASLAGGSLQGGVQAPAALNALTMLPPMVSPEVPGAPATAPSTSTSTTISNAGGTTGPGIFLGGSTRAASFTGGPAFGGTNVAAFGGAVTNAGSMSFSGGQGGGLSLTGGASANLSVGGGRRTNMIASIRGGNRIAMFGGAARGRVPGDEMNQFNARGGLGNITSVDNRRSLNMGQGPLDVDNWQSTRVSNLVIRNVPGSNVFAQATGMAG